MYRMRYISECAKKKCSQSWYRVADGAAGVAIPVGIEAVLNESIRRVAVHVYPRARSGNRARQTQPTTETRLLVPVLVERLLRSAENGRTWPIQHNRNATAAAPFAREVPRLDLLEGPFLRVWEFFVDVAFTVAACKNCCSSVGPERHVTEIFFPLYVRPDPDFRYRPDTTKTRKKYAALTPRLDRVGPVRHHGHPVATQRAK